MKVRIISPTRRGGEHLKEGRVLPVSDDDGAILIAAGKAVRFVEPPKPEPSENQPG